MSDLEADDQDLLARVAAKEELRAVFFRRIADPKWFEALIERGYFKPDAMPVPTEPDSKGYVRIPVWDVLEYLMRLAPKVVEMNDEEKIWKIVQTISDVTAYAEREGISNYQVWWRFSEILSVFPPEFFPKNLSNLIRYWLSDRYETSVISRALSEMFSKLLLEPATDVSRAQAISMLDVFFDFQLKHSKFIGRERTEAKLLLEEHYAKKLIASGGQRIGAILRGDAVDLFRSKLSGLVVELGNDEWSSLWQPAIEDHKQNEHHNDAENVLVQALREALLGLASEEITEAENFIDTFLDSDFEILQRVGLHLVAVSDDVSNAFTQRVICKKYFKSNLRHEVWNFLNIRYLQFTAEQKEEVLSIVDSLEQTDDCGKQLKGPTAYERACWVAAIREYGDKERELYAALTRIAQSEPEHPDFTSYFTMRSGGRPSPYTASELRAKGVGELVALLSDFEQEPGWDKPGIEGLTKVLVEVIKAAPMKYWQKFDQLFSLDLPYVHSVLRAYEELWKEKVSLPWAEIWPSIIEAVTELVSSDEFWSEVNAEQRTDFVANRHWIVSLIAEILESGAKSDEHAFPEAVHGDVLNLLCILLEKQDGPDFNGENDPVSLTINSPRGRCLEALINLCLRECRLSDSRNDGDHTGVWQHYESIYERELKNGEAYEFFTLMANYLPNFLYMSQEWTVKSLPTLFSRDDENRWVCAVEGYSYVNKIYPEVYEFLQSSGTLIQALDSDKLKGSAQEKIIQNIVISFIAIWPENWNNHTLISVIRRGNSEEVQHVIHFMSGMVKNGDSKLQDIVRTLWSDISRNIDFESEEGQVVASDICKWIEFFPHIDEEDENMISRVIPFSDVNFNSYFVLEYLSKISLEQPLVAGRLWLEMLKKSSADYPEEAIKKLFGRLCSAEKDGELLAKDVVNSYLKRGMSRPAEIWRETFALGGQGSS